jgi:hypothetical protein
VRTRPDQAQVEEIGFLDSIGIEIANIHLETKASTKPILRRVNKQRGKRLHEARAAMLKIVREDCKT